MRSLLSALACTMLAGCETIRVQGVEITPERQFETAVTLMMIGTAIHVFAYERDADDSSGKRTCLRYLSVPPGKDAPLICADDL